MKKLAHRNSSTSFTWLQLEDCNSNVTSVTKLLHTYTYNIAARQLAGLLCKYIGVLCVEVCIALRNLICTLSGWIFLAFANWCSRAARNYATLVWYLKFEKRNYNMRNLNRKVFSFSTILLLVEICAYFDWIFHVFCLFQQSIIYYTVSGTYISSLPSFNIVILTYFNNISVPFL